jgi:hypothetical protein
MVPDPFQALVARLALAAAQPHGFALAGGNALIKHGIVDRSTVDVDLFTDQPDGVRAATGPVTAALTAAGLQVEAVEDDTEPGAVFEGFDSDMAEFEVHDGTDTVLLQLVRFDRSRDPVNCDIGPLLHLDDVIGTKVAAMVSRAEPRDFVDVAAALDRYTRDQLLDLGRRADPALTDDEFGPAFRRLDRLDDTVFALYGLDADQVAALRARFVDWPR